MAVANSKATPLLLQEMDNPLPTWPTIFSDIDVIANRLTPRHTDKGGAFTFYDHLISFGGGHNAVLLLDDLHAEFRYLSGTSVLFSGKALNHSVLDWSGGERMVVAHYAKDDVHDRLGVSRPQALPTQFGWWSKYGMQ
jgi:hypothetical protein